MENIIFKRLDEDTLKTIKEPIILNEEIYNKKQLERFINNKNNYAFVGIHEDEVIAFLYGYGMVRPDVKRGHLAVFFSALQGVPKNIFINNIFSKESMI